MKWFILNDVWIHFLLQCSYRTPVDIKGSQCMERRILVTSPVLLSLKRDVQIFINSLQPRSPLRFCFLARVPFFSLLASEDRALPSVCMFYIDCCQQDLAEMVKDRLVPFLSKNGNHCPERVCHTVSWGGKGQRVWISLVVLPILSIHKSTPICSFKKYIYMGIYFFFPSILCVTRKLLKHSTAAAFVIYARKKKKKIHRHAVLTRQCKSILQTLLSDENIFISP